MSLKANLTQAKTNKKDEFYTQLKDIENELRHYKEHFKGKMCFARTFYTILQRKSLYRIRQSESRYLGQT